MRKLRNETLQMHDSIKLNHAVYSWTKLNANLGLREDLFSCYFITPHWVTVSVHQTKYQTFLRQLSLLNGRRRQCLLLTDTELQSLHVPISVIYQMIKTLLFLLQLHRKTRIVVNPTRKFRHHKSKIYSMKMDKKLYLTFFLLFNH